MVESTKEEKRANRRARIQAKREERKARKLKSSIGIRKEDS